MKFPSIPLKHKTPVLVAAMLLGVAAPALGATSVPAGPAMPDFVMTSEAGPERIHMAQSQEAAQLAVRIQQLEEQIRSLNGQIEGLTFQLTQMQTLIERMTEDNEFRFTQLEGGAGGKTDAATQPGGVTQPEALPQTTTPTDTTVAPTIIPEQGVRPLPGEAEFDPTFDDGSVAPADTVGNSGDPLLGTGQGAVGAELGTGQPLDLTYTPGATGSGGNPDADAQFKAGYDALVAGDFAFAEDQFSQFIALYPDDPQAGDAANWLGEALIQRSAYDEVAEVLLTAFQKAPESPRAPDLLLKLGVSLAGAQERETACRTFGEIDKRYPNLPAAFLTKLGEEKARAECPPA